MAIEVVAATEGIGGTGAESGERPRDGRYEGGDRNLFVVLRVDLDGSGVISGDVYRVNAATREYVASVRTAPGVVVTWGVAGHDTWVAAWQDSLGAVTTGGVDIAPVAGTPDTLAVTLRLDRRLNGLPAGTDLTVPVVRVAAELRSLGLEIDTEAGVRLPGPVQFGGAEAGFRECLQKAGFAVQDVGAPTLIPRQPGGWSGSSIFTVLHDLMTSSATASLLAPAWELHLLMLSESSRDGLLGVMFDSFDELPRQGAAVFVDEIRSHVPDEVEDRKIVQTAVHELGHALNLAHRFERSVGRADSTSFMNYDWRYLGGQHADEFWQRFAFAFDADELEFLRHAPHAALVPGGAPFHSINYWADGTGGYSPYVPEVSVEGFELSLAPPATGPLFGYGQPVFLEVALRNLGTQAVELPPETLDPKTGALEILVRRYTGGTGNGLAEAVPFVPMMQRCYQLDESAAETLPAGGTLRNNVNLTFGSGGFTFAEPGAYDLIPLLSFAGRDPEGEDVELIIRGRPLRIRVAYPQDRADERDAMTLFRPDVGAWFALGGAAALGGARDALGELCQDRRFARGAADPVVASIVRSIGIETGRPSVRFHDGRFHQGDGDPVLAARILGELDQGALRTFDAYTARSTAALTARYQAAATQDQE
ncbi:MAG TPA: hypothetical protein VF755_21545 [Catenuloplanes sp.]